MHVTFRFDLLKALFECLQRDDASAGEIVAIFALLQQMLHRFSEGELIRSVPMLMTLLQYFVKNDTKPLAHRVSVHTGIVNYFLAADAQLGFPTIKEHVNKVKAENLEANTWAGWWPLDVDMDVLISMQYGQVSDTTPITYLDKDVIVDALCRDPRLQMQYSDLTSTLGDDFTQMKPPKDEEKNQISIRSSRNMEAFKPKLARYLPSLDDMTPSKPPTICVENLRETLATTVQQATSEPSELSIDDSDSHSFVMSVTSKRERQVGNKDVDNILKSLGTNTRAARSNISLVYSPI
jgi:hypothetical protein